MLFDQVTLNKRLNKLACDTDKDGGPRSQLQNAPFGVSEGMQVGSFVWYRSKGKNSTAIDLPTQPGSVVSLSRHREHLEILRA